MKHCIAVMLIFTAPFSISAQQVFDAPCNFSGSITVYDTSKNIWLSTDIIDAHTGSLPASTFKIPNTLILLDSGIADNEEYVIRWPGSIDTVKYGNRTSTYKDMTLEKAFRVSAGWAYVEMAAVLGKNKYAGYLSKLNYGNQNFSVEGNDFWNFGPFEVTPVQQIQLLKNLLEGELPFEKDHMQLLKKIMITEETDQYRIHSKTGWTRDGNKNTGWWVGYLDSKIKPDHQIIFATRIIDPVKVTRRNFGSCRKIITKKFISTSGLTDISLK